MMPFVQAIREVGEVAEHLFARAVADLFQGGSKSAQHLAILGSCQHSPQQVEPLPVVTEAL
jgi:hypothetical protein